MIANRKPFHAFEYACALNDIDHRLTKPKHTNSSAKPGLRSRKDSQ
jgi:hypothetical protein